MSLGDLKGRSDELSKLKLERFLLLLFLQQNGRREGGKEDRGGPAFFLFFVLNLKLPYCRSFIRA